MHFESGAVVAVACALVVGCSSTPAPPSQAETSSRATVVPADGTPGSTGSSGGATGAAGGFTVAASGDILVHLAVAQRALRNGRGRRYEFRPMLAKIRARVEGADLALCHVETPLSGDDRHISGYPMFNTPHELADAIAWAGYDGCSTASNHSLDRGTSGVADTLRALDRAGVTHDGTARDRQEAEHAEVHVVRGARVAHLSYTFGTNGVPVPKDAPWTVRLLSVARILHDAHRARARGADFVVLSLHWGDEYVSAPTATQLRQAAALLASPDVDLVLGDHVHVQQPVLRFGGKFAVFGMGNLLSNQSPRAGLPPQTQDGAVVTVHVSRRAGRLVADGVDITATYCEIGTYTVWPIGEALADPATPDALRPALSASLSRTRAVYAREGQGPREVALH